MSNETDLHASSSTVSAISTSTSPRNSSDSLPRPPLHPPQDPSPTNNNRSSLLFNSLTSAASYFADPVRYTVSGLVRRLSEDEAPTPLARALSANYNGSMIAPPQPIMRRKSPFQPPPLTPLTLDGYKRSTTSSAKILKRAVAEEIRLLVPPRLQLQDTWHLSYSLEQDGSTLSTLYSQLDVHRGKRGGFVIVIRDGSNGVFGAYLSDAPRISPHYFGSGECFLWRAMVLPALPSLSDLPPPPSADTEHAQRMTTVGMGSRTPSSNSLASMGKRKDERIRFKAFPYTGENDFSIFCQQEYLSVGGGDGHYGLWLGQDLSEGSEEHVEATEHLALSCFHLGGMAERTVPGEGRERADGLYTHLERNQDLAYHPAKLRSRTFNVSRQERGTLARLACERVNRKKGVLPCTADSASKHDTTRVGGVGSTLECPIIAIDVENVLLESPMR